MQTILSYQQHQIKVYEVMQTCIIQTILLNDPLKHPRKIHNIFI